MSDANSTPTTPRSKPAKPYPDFPLFPHASGQWCKKIRGLFVYFGPWEDANAALNKYLAEKDALHAGRKPKPDPNALTVKEAVTAFLNAKQALMDAGELSRRTWAGYKLATDEVIAHLGKTRLVADLDPQDFASLRVRMSRKWGPHRLGTTIQYVRSIFKHAFEAGLVPTPARFGPDFKRPAKKAMRLHRAKQGLKLYTREEIHQLLDASGPALKAMILLGINCGFGNADCGKLPLSALDLDGGWVNFPRPKTGIDRRGPLWPETIRAIREALSKRPQPKSSEHADLVFITKYGLSWSKDTSTNPVSQEMAKVLKALHINGRKGLNFYTLRHVFRTVAEESKDQPAVDFIMGHARDDMASVYRERIDDARLKAVADYVRRWLFASASTQAAGTDKHEAIAV
jgi:integrase